MKKQLFLSLIAALMMTLGVNAQENTYNMVINMANGNTITIGPNEIDNIAFNDGAVVVSGTKIDDLMAAISANRNDIERNMSYIEQIFQKTYENREIINENRAIINDNRAIIKDYLHEFLKKIKGDVQLLNPETGEPYTYRAWDSNAGTYVDKPVTMAEINNNLADIRNLEMMLAQLNNEIMIQNDAIQALKELVSVLEARIRTLEERLANQ